jgi:translation initiation factor IF-3
LRPRRGVEARPQEPRTRVNEAIRVPRVRLISETGEQVGVLGREEAMEYAWGRNLDLVEVAPDSNPPVCRVMDYSKYKYEQEQKQKLARKHQSTITVKEIKLRPKIGAGDYETKKGHVVRFLRNLDKVKVTIMFRGREMYHPERGRLLLMRLAEDVKDLAVIEAEPLQDGRNMVMMLAPTKDLLATGKPESAPAPRAVRQTRRQARQHESEHEGAEESAAPETEAAAETEAAPETEAAAETEAAPEAEAASETEAAPETGATEPARAATAGRAGETGES